MNRPADRLAQVVDDVRSAYPDDDAAARAMLLAVVRHDPVMLLEMVRPWLHHAARHALLGASREVEANDAEAPDIGWHARRVAENQQVLNSKVRGA